MLLGVAPLAKPDFTRSGRPPGVMAPRASRAGHRKSNSIGNAVLALALFSSAKRSNELAFGKLVLRLENGMT
jgi:hypothetical protein